MHSNYLLPTLTLVLFFWVYGGIGFRLLLWRPSWMDSIQFRFLHVLAALGLGGILFYFGITGHGWHRVGDFIAMVAMLVIIPQLLRPRLWEWFDFT